MRRHSLLALAIVAAGLLAATSGRAEQQRPSPALPARAVLYEEDPVDSQGRKYDGSVVWRIVSVKPNAGAVEPVIHADVEVPERGIKMTLALRRNQDPARYASHVIEVAFDLSPVFTSAGIQNVPGLLMKQTEQTRGSPLLARTMRVAANAFHVDLSASENDQPRNLALLKERSWFDVPIVYSNGRRAILAFEKGSSGEEAFDAVLTAWGQ